VPTPTWVGGPLPPNATPQQRVASEMYMLHSDVKALLMDHASKGRGPDDPQVRQMWPIS
jgi:hypothetical protein